MKWYNSLQNKKLSSIWNILHLILVMGLMWSCRNRGHNSFAEAHHPSETPVNERTVSLRDTVRQKQKQRAYLTEDKIKQARKEDSLSVIKEHTKDKEEKAETTEFPPAKGKKYRGSRKRSFRKPLRTKITTKPEPKPTLRMEHETFYFDTVKAGAVIQHRFFFSNTGAAPLTFKNGHASCGCTTPTFPKEPVKPGQASYIYVSFNTREKSGNQDAKVYFETNASGGEKILHLKGYVKE